METFSALLVLCAGNSPVTGEFPAQRPVSRSFNVFFDLRLNKPLSKQSWGWWFDAPSLSLWRHSNVIQLPLMYSRILLSIGATRCQPQVSITGPPSPGRGWHLIYVRTSIWIALVVLRTPYVDRVYRENLGMDWHIFTFRCWFDRAMPFAVRDG